MLDVRNWFIAGGFLGVLVIFGLILYKVIDDTTRERDEAWKSELTARNIKYHNEMMLKDGKIRRREEEIHAQLEEQRKLREENEKLLQEFNERVPLSDACTLCRVSRDHFQLPVGPPSSSPTPAPSSSKGGTTGSKEKSNVPKPRENRIQRR